MCHCCNENYTNNVVKVLVTCITVTFINKHVVIAFIYSNIVGINSTSLHRTFPSSEDRDSLGLSNFTNTHTYLMVKQEQSTHVYFDFA